MSAQRRQPRNGLAVDRSGGPVVDPTENVVALVKAEKERQDDLRVLTKELFDGQMKCLKEIGEMRERHAMESREGEKGRLDAIRQVDREDVNKTASQALQAIQTLANTTNTTAETLRNQVATVAEAAARQRAADTSETNKRLSALELALSEGKGKQTVSDPQSEKLFLAVENLTRAQATGTGKSAGSTAMWGYVVGGIGLLITIAMFFLAILGAALAMWAK